MKKKFKVVRKSKVFSFLTFKVANAYHDWLKEQQVEAKLIIQL